MIKIAIIGLGHIGQIHLAAINSIKEYRLIGICDKKVYEYQNMVSKSVRTFTDYFEMLNKLEIDVVVIATPNDTHFNIACDVIKMGLNVILEKPASNNLIQLKKMQDLAIKNKVFIYYAFHSALSLEVNTFFDFYKNNKEAFGPLIGFSSFFYDPYIKNNQIIKKAKGLENCWLDSGVNALSIIDKFSPVSNLKNLVTRKSFINENIYSSISCSFSISDEAENLIGTGNIETAWDQDINKKITYLCFQEKNKLILLDHSNQKVFEITSGNLKILYSFEGDRLLNHYLGIFKEFYNLYVTDKVFNFSESLRIHNLLFNSLT